MTDAQQWLPETGLGPDPAHVREVLAIRPGGLGDVVRAVPALRHLRRVYDVARISVAAPGTARDLLASCPYVDRVIDIARPSEALVERFDIALSFAAPGAVTKLGVDDVAAQFRAAWCAAGSGERSAIHPEWPERLSDGERMVRLAWLLGGSASETTLGLWPTLADRNGAAQLVGGHRRPIAAIHVAAGTAKRRWPTDRWARVIDLVDSLGLQPALIGSRRDQQLADSVVVESRSAPLSLVGNTTVGLLAGVLERSVLFVGSDSGPAALASALGVRSIVIGPASNVELPASPGAIDLVTAGPCPACGESACAHPMPAATEVPLEAVLARVSLAAATALERWQAQQIA